MVDEVEKCEGGSVVCERVEELLAGGGVLVDVVFDDTFRDIVQCAVVDTLEGRVVLENALAKEEADEAYWFEDQRRYADGLWRE